MRHPIPALSQEVAKELTIKVLPKVARQPRSPQFDRRKPQGRIGQHSPAHREQRSACKASMTVFSEWIDDTG